MANSLHTVNGEQVSCGIHTKVSKEDGLLGNMGGYPGSVQVERCGNHRRERNAGPYSSVMIDSTKVFRVKFHGISEGEGRDDDIRAIRKFEV